MTSWSQPPSPRQTTSETMKEKEPLEIIQTVLEELEQLKERVSKFEGLQSEDEYRFLDEMLTRILIKLDNIDTNGVEEVKTARRATILQVQETADQLEAKAKAKKKALEDEDEGQVNDFVQKDTCIALESESPFKRVKTCPAPLEHPTPNDLKNPLSLTPTQVRQSPRLKRHEQQHEDNNSTNISRTIHPTSSNHYNNNTKKKKRKG